MNIVYGGSFNPPTKAHLMIVEKLYSTFKPENIIILPVGDTYNLKNTLINYNHRFKMLEILFNEKNYIEISNLEEKEFKGTLFILDKISKDYSDLYFVLGSDNLSLFHEWINYEILLKKYKFIIIKRPNYELDLSLFDKYNSKYFILEFESNISSSKIRSNLNKYKNDLSSDIYSYIIKNKLYGVK